MEEMLGVAVSVDKEEIGVLAVWLLCVGNGVVWAVESGSLEEPYVNRGSLIQL